MKKMPINFYYTGNLVFPYEIHNLFGYESHTKLHS